MQRITSRRPELPLFDIATTRQLESQALAAAPPHTLMRRAGLATARLALALAPHAQTVRIVVGPGNNGGDGLEAAVELTRRGKTVEVLRVGAGTSDGALDALQRARAAGVNIDPAEPAALGAQDLAIDALLGIGASRAPEGALAAAIGALNALPCPVLAIDLPSGLDADTGAPLGEACVRAAHTLTLLTLKPGLFTAAGRDLAGTVWLDDLGVTTADAAPRAWLYGGDRGLPARRHVQHKGSFGDVAVVGGADGMTGAAWLAARAAHAAGAGRVFVELLGGTAAALDPQRPELMLRRDWTQHSTPPVLAASTVVCGCGGGEAVARLLPRLLAHVPRLVLDADALNTIAADTQLQMQLRERSRRGAATVLTPHPLEAARLLGIASQQVQADRLVAAITLADRLQCVVLLKGSGSVLAAPGRVPRINASGNASLASAGTGDVLAGWLGGHWSQRSEDDPFERAALAAAHSAWLHGAAAEAAARPVLRASRLVEVMADLAAG